MVEKTENELDKKAMEMSIAESIKEAILGLCGDKDESQMVTKMHVMVGLADKLRINNLEIKINLKELRASKKLYDKLMLEDDD